MHPETLRNWVRQAEIDGVCGHARDAALASPSRRPPLDLRPSATRASAHSDRPARPGRPARHREPDVGIPDAFTVNWPAWAITSRRRRSGQSSNARDATRVVTARSRRGASSCGLRLSTSSPVTSSPSTPSCYGVSTCCSSSKSDRGGFASPVSPPRRPAPGSPNRHATSSATSPTHTLRQSRTWPAIETRCRAGPQIFICSIQSSQRGL